MASYDRRMSSPPGACEHGEHGAHGAHGEPGAHGAGETLTAPAGVLLTGGRSRRLGVDKALLLVDGEPVAVRLGRLLAAVASPAVEVGPGRSELPSLQEPAAGEGPLTALLAGVEALESRGHRGPVMVLACDLARLGEPLARFVARYPGARSVVPLSAGRLQVLCARYSPGDLDLMARAASKGARSLSALVPELDSPRLLAEDEWRATGAAGELDDVDTPEDLATLRAEGFRP